MNKDTLIMLNFDATADFESIYNGYRNMLDAKKKINRTICECMSVPIERVAGNIKTGLGMSDATY
jgi:hypothetical protein